MWKDEIVEETWKARDNHAKQFNYNLKAIYQALKKEERKTDLAFVSHPRKRKAQAK